MVADLLLYSSTAHALVIKSFSKATDSRFTSNTIFSSWSDTGPGNQTCQYAVYDFSGVGWPYNSSDATASRQAISLVSAQYALTAWHVAPTTSESVRFRNTSGTVLTFGINSVTRIGSTDLALIILQTAAAPTDIYSGQITLAGINSAVASGMGYYDSIATRVADYDTSIDAIPAHGHSLSVVPEPATTALCIVASAMV